MRGGASVSSGLSLLELAAALLASLALFLGARFALRAAGRLLRSRLEAWAEAVAPLAAPSKTVFVLALVVLWARFVVRRGPVAEWVEFYAWGLLWAALVWFAVRAVNVLVLGLHYQRTKGAPLPGVFRAIVNGVVYAAVLVVALNRFYGIALGDLVFWGAALAVVLGIALQSVLWSLFAGLVLYFQDMFRVGDAVRVGEAEGTVVAIDWRTTTLRSDDGDLITLPNWTVSQATVVNYHRPDPRRRLEVEVEVLREAPPNAAARLLESQAAMAEGVLRSPRPRAHLRAPGRYVLECWIGERGEREPVADRVRRLAWYGLRRAGWNPDAPPPAP
ncbi:MAG: hypothetical protein D6731_20125, partial [Planctomycetota bacterium]